MPLTDQLKQLDDGNEKDAAGDHGDHSSSVDSSSSSGHHEHSKDYVEDSTTTGTGFSNTRKSSSMGGATWLDDGSLSTSRSSTLVMFLVFASAAIFGSVLYVLADQSDLENFRTKFNDGAEEILEVAQERSRNFINSMNRLSLTMTDTAAQQDSATAVQWPFYTLPNLGVFANNILEDDSSIMLAYAPKVDVSIRERWEQYTWDNQDLVIAQEVPENKYLPFVRANITEYIHRIDEETEEHVVEGYSPYYIPVWQMYPVPKGDDNVTVVNLNLLSDLKYQRLSHALEHTRRAVVSQAQDTFDIFGIPKKPKVGYVIGPQEDPHSLVVQPIFENFKEDSVAVAHLVATKPWNSYLENIVQDDRKFQVHCIIKDSCDRPYTFWMNGTHTIYQGKGDLHDRKHDDMERTSVLTSYTLDAADLGPGDYPSCTIELSVYPTLGMREEFDSNEPARYLVMVIFLSGILAVAFITHNHAVSQKQRVLQIKTQRSNAIVASLFPEQIRDKLFGEDGGIKEEGLHLINSGAQKSLDSVLKGGKKLLPGADFDDDAYQGKQIADLFPNCTVVFADIVGFTAWSSAREPTQVFTLLETVFRAFDEIASRRRVFKVETIGDCYLAVAGLPTPRKDHALVMARFSRDCLQKFQDVGRMLEVTLGPDTGDLGVRFGLHSGPVTAGVLRGERGRFQLFGDTVNTGSRLETTGEKNRIHISKETADLVRASGKGSWVRPRGETVQAKGKGELETFWLLPKAAWKASSTGSTNSHTGSSVTGRETSESSYDEETGEPKAKRPGPDGERLGTSGPTSRKAQSEAKLERLIFWVSESLLQSLRHVVARRQASSQPERRGPAMESVRELEKEMSKNKIVLGEVREVIALPKFDAEAYKHQVDPKTIKLDPKVETQLREYVAVIASLYHDNPFHNFQHASHVTMSIMKLLSRIVAPDNVNRDSDPDKDDVAAELSDYTYGITNDPLTQFSALLSAVIHDVDHRGIGNGDLCKENEALAKAFDYKSVAEQNSIDLAWEALMDPNFTDLRDCIYTDATELRRFRQLLVNSVLATDIFDKELSALRKKRWEKAFSVADKDATQEDIHRKATIVIEHLIQASDVSHTMQHWQVYIKWNEHFFAEQYASYKAGRTPNDPSVGWYKGEMWFYDNYIIPLAKKLKDCGVFGVSSDEYLNYAVQNRTEWENKGQQVVANFVEKYSAQTTTIKEEVEDSSDSQEKEHSSSSPDLEGSSDKQKNESPASK